jgi:hypothetical protein
MEVEEMTETDEKVEAERKTVIGETMGPGEANHREETMKL